jgi:hypothetical protein
VKVVFRMRAMCLLSVAVVLYAIDGPRAAPCRGAAAARRAVSVRVAPQTAAVVLTPIAVPSTPA